MSRPILSKSTFLMGSQCPKRLWLYKKRPDLRTEASDNQQLIFEKGTDVGLLARELVPGGKDATPCDYRHFDEAFQMTADWVASGAPVIYEAAFVHNGVMAALDILVRKRGRWYGYEVKSSTEIKDYQVLDAAVQYYVLKGAGLELQDFSIIHINNQYTRNGELDLNQLFTIRSVKKEILALQAGIPAQVEAFKTLLRSRKEPETDIGPHCSEPYPCPFSDHCWSHVPEVSVFSLSRMTGARKFELYSQGIIEYHQLPSGIKLTTAQALQVRCWQENRVHTVPDKIRAWLKQLSWPLYFMDFETFTPAVPLYDRSRPFQHILFQFSLHVQKTPRSGLKHMEYLGEPETDPRPAFIKQLLEALGTEGTILVYNKTFEITRLRELQTLYPKLKKPIEQVISRIIDLMEPFQQKWYYDPSMNGSYSIKQVLPALVPELSYKDLEIGEGGTAMAAFEGLLKIGDKKEREKIRKQLLEYCGLDTMAMVRILDKLKSNS